MDQRIDWAAAMSLGRYRVGDSYKFHVYDPGTGNALVTVRVGKTEDVRVPAGTFRAVRIVYTIGKGKGPEEYQVLMCESSPHFMAREEFLNGAVTELVEVKP